MTIEEQIENWFMYHPPTPEQAFAYTEIRRAARALAVTIVAHAPHSADRSAALRKLREAVMTANAAIACGGQ